MEKVLLRCKLRSDFCRSFLRTADRVRAELALRAIENAAVAVVCPVGSPQKSTIA